jgi:hypothetical protein
VIHSRPEGAKLYLDGALAGRTPHSMTDTKVAGTVTRVRLELEGYEPLRATIVRDEEFALAPCLLGIAAIVPWPWLWIMRYHPSRTYDLSPLPAGRAQAVPPSVPIPP